MVFRAVLKDPIATATFRHLQGLLPYPQHRGARAGTTIVFTAWGSSTSLASVAGVYRSFLAGAAGAGTDAISTNCPLLACAVGVLKSSGVAFAHTTLGGVARLGGGVASATRSNNRVVCVIVVS